MGVDYNIVIAEGLVLYDPDSYLNHVVFEDMDGMTENDTDELYNKYLHEEYNIVYDCYASNAPIFIYKEETVIKEDTIFRAYGALSKDEITDGTFKDRPYIIGKNLAVYPIDFYIDDDKQEEKIKNILDIFPISCNESGFLDLRMDKDKLDLNKMRYGKHVFVYYS